MATANTRDRLIDIGVQQIRNDGYNATGVKQILDLAGVPKGSFYHYFPSKEFFAEEVLARYVASDVARLEPLLLDSETPPLTRLRNYFEGHTAIYAQTGLLNGCLIGNLSLEIGDHIPSLQSRLTASLAGWEGMLAELVREAARRGDLPTTLQPDETAAFILNSWHGALVRMKADQSLQPIHSFLHYIFDILLKK